MNTEKMLNIDGYKIPVAVALKIHDRVEAFFNGDEVVSAIAVERLQGQEKPRKTAPCVRLEIPANTHTALRAFARDTGKSMGEIVRRILEVETKTYDPATLPVGYARGTKMIFTNVRVSQKMKETLCYRAKALGMSIGGYAGRLVCYHVATKGV